MIDTTWTTEVDRCPLAGDKAEIVNWSAPDEPIDILQLLRDAKELILRQSVFHGDS